MIVDLLFVLSCAVWYYAGLLRGENKAMERCIKELTELTEKMKEPYTGE